MFHLISDLNLTYVYYYTYLVSDLNFASVNYIICLVSDLNLGDTTDYTSQELNILFQRGQEYEKNFNPAAALQCYLGCMKGLKNRKMFDHLPQCIHKVSGSM